MQGYSINRLVDGEPDRARQFFRVPDEKQPESDSAGRLNGRSIRAVDVPYIRRMRIGVLGDRTGIPYAEEDNSVSSSRRASSRFPMRCTGAARADAGDLRALVMSNCDTRAGKNPGGTSGTIQATLNSGTRSSNSGPSGFDGEQRIKPTIERNFSGVIVPSGRLQNDRREFIRLVPQVPICRHLPTCSGLRDMQEVTRQNLVGAMS